MIDLPVAQCAEELKEGAFFAVQLTRDGELSIDGRSASLDQLSKSLEDRCERHSVEVRRLGRPATEVVSAGRVGWTLPVVIRADKDALWAHVQYVHTVLIEQRLSRVYWAAHQCASASHTAEEVGQPRAERSIAKPPEHVVRAFMSIPPKEPRIDAIQQSVVRVRVVGRDFVRVERGPKGDPVGIQWPRSVTYEFAGQAADDLLGVEQWLGRHRKQPVGDRASVQVGEIVATRILPFKYVVALYDRYVRQGYSRIDYFEALLPSPEERARRRLPVKEWGEAR